MWPQLRGRAEETTRRSRPEDNVIAVGVGVTMGASVQIGTKSIQLLAKPSGTNMTLAGLRREIRRVVKEVRSMASRKRKAPA